MDLKVSQLISFLVAALGLFGEDEACIILSNLFQEDLSLKFDVTRFDSVRFSNVIQKNYKGTHADQVIREETTSSFILELKSDGTATACKGWRYLFFNSGPQVNETEHIHEQLGYSGKWNRIQNDGWLNLDLFYDDSSCPDIREYSKLIPKHSLQWHLHCLPLILKDHPKIKYPILACQFIDQDKVFGEDEPHLITDNVHQEQWLLLGAGNGLKIKIISNDLNNENMQTVQIDLAPERVTTDDWKQSF